MVGQLRTGTYKSNVVLGSTGESHVRGACISEIRLWFIEVLRRALCPLHNINISGD